MIKQQTEAFLADGKHQIEHIPNGVTGYNKLAGPRHIKLNSDKSSK